MVGGGQQAPCQALSHTAVLAKMGWEQPQQQAELHSRMGEGRGSPPPPRERAGSGWASEG